MPLTFSVASFVPCTLAAKDLILAAKINYVSSVKLKTAEWPLLDSNTIVKDGLGCQNLSVNHTITTFKKKLASVCNTIKHDWVAT